MADGERVGGRSVAPASTVGRLRTRILQSIDGHAQRRNTDENQRRQTTHEPHTTTGAAIITAATLGASPFQVWKNVDWPILSRATLSAATFAFTVSLGEFGAAILLTRPEYPTIPVAISRFLSQPGGLNYGQAMAMATILLVITTLGILLIEKIRLPGAGEF